MPIAIVVGVVSVISIACCMRYVAKRKTAKSKR
jgi:heme/copper-type cytochrome/quinol oxidase subunit 2